MNDSQPPSPAPTASPRARLQELLAIPDRNRTDAEWDELNELEIALASGNRPGAPDPNRFPNRSGSMAGYFGSDRGYPSVRATGFFQTDTGFFTQDAVSRATGTAKAPSVIPARRSRSERSSPL